MNCRSAYLTNEIDVSASKYSEFWEKEMGEIRANRRRNIAAIKIQSTFRKYCGRLVLYRKELY